MGDTLKQMANKHMKRYSASLVIKEMQIKFTVRYSFNSFSRFAVIKQLKNNKCWQGHGEVGTFVHCLWECKMVKPLWKRVLEFLKNINRINVFCSVTQSCPTLLRPHGLQHARPPCPSPSPEVCPSSCPLHGWCHPTISFLDALFSFCPWSSPASGTFPVSRLFASGDQNYHVTQQFHSYVYTQKNWK